MVLARTDLGISRKIIDMLENVNATHFSKDQAKLSWSVQNRMMLPTLLRAFTLPTMEESKNIQPGSRELFKIGIYQEACELLHSQTKAKSMSI